MGKYMRSLVHMGDQYFEFARICGTKVLRYPKKCSSGSAKGFGECIYMRVLFLSLIIRAAHLFKVLDIAHEAKLSGVPTTKR